jgi:ribosomal protein L11 methyltransferase
MDSKAPEGASVTSLATLITDEQSARRIADIFAESFTGDEVAVSLGDIGQGNWRVAIHFRMPPDEAPIRELVIVATGPDAAKALRFERIAAKDWVGESLAGLKPVTAGRFIVHGAHDRGGVPRNRIGIEIEAALAFGTGHHGTTRGCLFALDHICRLGGRAPRRILDVGTGSGILAIAAARALRLGVLATDIDVSSVRVARENAKLNRAGNFITFMHADGVTAPPIYARAPFDLIFANILLMPLQRLAAPLRQILAPGGRIVLSGLLNSQANAALSAYRPLPLERRIELDGWTTLVLRRSVARSVIARRRRDP